MKTTKTIESLIENELGITNDNCFIEQDLMLNGQCKSTSFHLVLVRELHKNCYHIIRYWGDGTSRIVTLKLTCEEAKKEMLRIVNSLLR